MTPETATQPTELEPTVLDTEPDYKPAEFSDGAVLTEEKPGLMPRAEPVSGADRYYSVDVLRGFALLGILAMNIVAFGWPGVAYGNPLRGGGFAGLDRGIWLF